MEIMQDRVHSNAKKKNREGTSHVNASNYDFGFLSDDLTHLLDEQVPVINEVLEMSQTSKDKLVDDCIKVIGCKGIFQNYSETVHVHPQLSSRILPFFQQYVGAPQVWCLLLS